MIIMYIPVVVWLRTMAFLGLLIPSWIPLSVMCCLLGVALVFSLFRIRKLKDEKGEMGRQVVERTELLAYATDRERKAQENITQANQSKRQLLSRINHEIRTPMNGVIGMAALLGETSLTSEQRDYTETIRNCGESLLVVINEILHGDILAHSKVESGKLELEQKDFDLRNSIEEVLDVFARKTARVDLELLYRIDSQVPSRIVGDSQRFRQVMMNLVENAVKFTQKGEVFINVQAVSPEDKRGAGADSGTVKLRFEVRDTGAGISEERLKVLLEDLSKVNMPGFQPSSTGVGLIISQKLISMMGGSISIVSTAGEGATVSFDISVKYMTSVRGSLNRDVAGLEGKRVLIVDDNATNRSILKEELEHWKLAPVVASSGAEALEILSRDENFDMVLTDLRMPEMDGVVLGQSVRQQNPKVPIILLSKEAGEEVKYPPDLFSAVVNKPIRQDMLSKHIISKLRNQGEPSSADDTGTGQKLFATFAQRNPLKILVAEDNRVNQKLAMKILTKLGYSPDIVQDGREALEVISNAKYDVILMDVQMPGMDGLEATRMIRLCLDVQPVIIAMTANSMQGDREECLNAGMDDYISKPVHLEELVILLEKWALAVKEKH